MSFFSDATIAKLQIVKKVADLVDSLLDFILDRLISKSFSLVDLVTIWGKIKEIIKGIKG